jgi:hypothetical protein
MFVHSDDAITSSLERNQPRIFQMFSARQRPTSLTPITTHHEHELSQVSQRINAVESERLLIIYGVADNHPSQPVLGISNI